MEERRVATMSQAHEVQQRLDEVQALRERLGTRQWQEEDWGLLERVLGSYERLLSMLCEAQITLKRLQTLIFGKRRRHGRASGTSTGGEAPGGGDDESGADTRPQSGVRRSGDEVPPPTCWGPSSRVWPLGDGDLRGGRAGGMPPRGLSRRPALPRVRPGAMIWRTTGGRETH